MSWENREQNSKRRQMVTLCFSLVLGVGLLILSLNMLSAVSASGPEDDPGGACGPVIGLASDALPCLATGDRLPGKASGVVRLTWRGQAERARLVLSVSGVEAAHTIKLNGQPVASAPIHPDGQPCCDGEPFYLDVPPGALLQGNNLVEITDDALPGDDWTATDVRLEVFGDLAVCESGGADGTGQIGAADGVPSVYIFTFTNSYDGTSQEAVAQIPEGYDGDTPAPLLIFVHGRNSIMQEGINTFGDAANARGWLLASPQLHGSWPIPPGCYEDPPVDCEYDDQVLVEKPGAFAYASLESQYDIIGTLNYMLGYYNVKHAQIYLTGYSMGGQIATVVAAKYPHVFAAVFDNKGPTDMAQWHQETSSGYYRRTMEKECHLGGDPKTPPDNPFCYQRRSGVSFASNYIHVPISITHSVSDTLVQIHHSWDLRDAINSHGPDQPASVFEDTVVGPTCPPSYHCYAPEPSAVLDFLGAFALNNNPVHVNVTCDESKSYYWLNIVQAGGDHWTQVEVACDPISATVTASISDTEPLNVGFNLGSTPMMGLIEEPGMGLPATTYLVKGGGNDYLCNYTSGYLTTTLSTAGQFSLTISAIEARLSADPTLVSGWHTATSTITAVLRDHLKHPVPDGTVVEFSTTAGTFPNAGSVFTATTVGGQGQVTTALTLTPGANPAEIAASVESITASAWVHVIYPAVEVSVAVDETMVHNGQAVTYTYQITNTGDITLTSVTLVDDPGTPENSGDDLTVCDDITLAPDATTNCSRSAALTQTTTSTATVVGQDPLGYDVTGSDSITVYVIPSPRIYLPIVVRG